MVINTNELKDKLISIRYFYLNQGRYSRAECFKEALDVVNSLERSMDENKGRVPEQPSKG